MNGGGFTTTRWSVVLAAANTTVPGGADALEKLCRTYWYPLYLYVRRRGHNPEAAQDLTQDFFEHLLEKKILQVVDARKGRFRSFLLASINNFLANEWDRGRTARRGGKHSIIFWHDQSCENCYLREPGHELTPERIFEQSWALKLLQTVMEQLKEEFVRAGREQLFEAIHACLSEDEGAGTYGEIAAKLNMTEGAVKMSVLRLRTRFRSLLRAEIAKTVPDPSEVEEELRHLFTCLSN